MANYHNKLLQATPFQLAQDLLCLGGEPFKLEDYPYLRAVYNTRASRVGLFTGRQVSKCCSCNELVRMGDGTVKRIVDIKIGEIVLSESQGISVPAIVTNVFGVRKRKCIKVWLDSYECFTVTPEHRIRVQDGFEEAEYLKPGDRVMSFKKPVGGQLHTFETVHAIADAGELDTVDIEVSGSSTFVLANGVVVHNSTTLASKLVLNAVCHPRSVQVFVAPLQEQAMVFAQQRLREFIAGSPIVQRCFFQGPAMVDQVLRRVFNTGSMISLGYAQRTADRLRGQSVKDGQMHTYVDPRTGETVEVGGAQIMFDECLATGTLVETPEGPQFIEDLKVGDTVWAPYSDVLTVPDEVLAVTYKGQRQTYEVQFEDGTILRCTENEKFLTDCGWKYLVELAPLNGTLVPHNMGPSFLLLAPDNSLKYVQLVKATPYKVEDVWDITTKHYHTFFANGIAVHNCQDIFPEIYPVVEEMAFRARAPRFWYCGTPKSMNNPMEGFRQRSTGAEWAVKCLAMGCGHWNLEWTEKNIGNTGVVCEQCGQPLNTNLGQWVVAKKMDIHLGRNAKTTMESYRVPQLIVKPVMDRPTKWLELLEKFRTYSNEKFRNEVLGLPANTGSQPVTIDQLRACCVADRPNEMPNPRSKRYPSLVMGVDWAFNGENSYTFVTIGGYNPFPSRFDVFYWKIFKGLETATDYKEDWFVKAAQYSNVQLLGCDWGCGQAQNLHLINRLGEDRIIQLWHTALNGAGAARAARVKWDPKVRKWHLARTRVLTDTFEMVRTKQITFPRESECTELFDHFLAEFLEYNEKTNTQKYVNVAPDDGLHSVTYAAIAGEFLLRGDFKGHMGSDTQSDASQSDLWNEAPDPQLDSMYG